MALAPYSQILSCHTPNATSSESALSLEDRHTSQDDPFRLRCQVQALQEELLTVRSQRDMLYGVLHVVREDLQIKSEQFESLFASLKGHPLMTGVPASSTLCIDPAPRGLHDVMSPVHEIPGVLDYAASPRSDPAIPLPASSAAAHEAEALPAPVRHSGAEVPMHDSTGFAGLPVEIFWMACDFMQYRELASCARVCRRWRHMTNDESLWKTTYLAKWRIPASQLATFACAAPWKDQFSDRLLIEETWERGKPTVSTLGGHTGTVMAIKFEGTRLVTAGDDGLILAWHMESRASRRSNRPGPAASPVWHEREDAVPAGAGAGARPVCREDAFIGGGTSGFLTQTAVATESKSSSPSAWRSFTAGIFGKAKPDSKMASPSHADFSGIHSSDAVTAAKGAPKVSSGGGDIGLMQQHHRCTKQTYRRATFGGHGGPVFCIDFDQNTLVSGSYDQTVKVWDMKTGVNTLTLRGHDSWVDAVKVDASHGSVLSASWDGTVKLWDIRDQPRTVCTLNQGLGNVVYCLQWNAHSGRVGTATRQQTVQVWDLNTQQVLQTFLGHTKQVYALHWPGVDESSIFASGGADRSIRIWDPRTSRCEMTLNGHNGPVLALQLDNQFRLVSGSYDKTVRVWDLRMGTCLRVLAGHSKAVFCLQTAYDRIVSGSADSTVRIWDFNR